MSTFVIHAVDIVTDDEALADEIHPRFILALGLPGAVRRRYGSSRRVLFYAHRAGTAPITKSKLEFEETARARKHLIEFLARGQQVVIEGPHAKGAMHYWQGGRGLLDGVETLLANRVTLEDVGRVMAELCAEVGKPYRSQGAQAALIDVMRNSSRKHQTVEMAMRHHPSLAVNKDAFDADPWQLSTPAGVMDLRTAKMSDHGPLMRM